jgi:hypothetical protein
VIVNNTGAANVGVGDPFHLLAEKFADAAFTEPVSEPVSLVLGVTGLAWLAFNVRECGVSPEGYDARRTLSEVSS